MELKNYLVEILSNIINDKLNELSLSNQELKKSQEYLKIEEMFSDSSKVLLVDNDELRRVLSDITDEDTVNGIISNIDMIKIVLNGENSGLDLSLDDGQLDLIHGVYDIVNSYRVNIEEENSRVRESLEDFISKCKGLSNEIGTGVVRSVDVLDSVFNESGVSVEDAIKCKFDILRSNNSNYNLNIDSKAKEEVDLRISFKKLGIELDSYSSFEKTILVNYSNIDSINSMIDYISSNNIHLSLRNLFIVLLFSSVSNLSSLNDICNTYDISFNKLFMMPGVFVSSSDLINKIIADNSSNDGYSAISYLEFVGSYYDVFVGNVSLISNSGRSVKACFDSNMLAFIIPDMSKNIAILESMPLADKEFSIVVINPFLATSISSFAECGLGEYIKSNPLRLTTSYYRFREMSARIIEARRGGKVIFRSLSDKKNYWLSRSITVGESEVIQMDFLKSYGLSDQDITIIKNNNYESIINVIMYNKASVCEVIDYLISIGISVSTLSQILSDRLDLFLRPVDSIKVSFDRFNLKNIVAIINDDIANLKFI